MNTIPFNILHHIYIIGAAVRRCIVNNPVQLCVPGMCHGWISQPTAGEDTAWTEKVHIQCVRGPIPRSNDDVRFHQQVLQRNPLHPGSQVCIQCLHQCGWSIVNGQPRKRFCSGTTFFECLYDTPYALDAVTHVHAGICPRCSRYHTKRHHNLKRQGIDPREGANSLTDRAT